MYLEVICEHAADDVCVDVRARVSDMRAVVHCGTTRVPRQRPPTATATATTAGVTGVTGVTGEGEGLAATREAVPKANRFGLSGEVRARERASERVREWSRGTSGECESAQCHDHTGCME
jgi:hypothetical protein